MKTAAPAESTAEKSVPSAEPVADTKDTIQRETVKTAAPAEPMAEKAVSFAEPVIDTIDTIQREPIKTAAPAEPQAEKAVPSAELVINTKDTIQREQVKTAAPVESQTEKAILSAEPVFNTKDTVQRESVKEVVSNETRSENEFSSLEAGHDVQDTIQREPLKSAEPFRTESEKPDLPVVHRQQSAESVQRETLKTAKPVNTLSAADLSGNVIQREKLTGEDVSQLYHGMTGASADASLIQREPNDDLTSLLKSLPSHYEMPKEQIESIRSGTPYTSQNNAVQREFIPPQYGNEQSKAQNSASLSEARAQSIVQREAEFVLPKRYTDNISKSEELKSTVQREVSSSHASKKSNSSLPMGNSGFVNSSEAASTRQNNNTTLSNYFPGVDNSNNNAQTSDTVQREFSDKLNSAIDSIMPDSLKSKPSSGQSDDNTEAAAKVTRRDLDILADKLLPRIKRIMRSEMERSIFR